MINRQREVIYQRRRQNLLQITGKEEIETMLQEVVVDFVATHTHAEDSLKWNKKEIYEHSQALFDAGKEIKEKIFQLADDKDVENDKKRKQIKKVIIDYAKQVYQRREIEVSSAIVRKVERIIALKTLDNLWMEHLDNMQHLREGVGLRGYGQRDPLIEYKKEGFYMFQDFLKTIKLNTIANLYKTKIQTKEDDSYVQEKRGNLQLKGADTAKSGFFSNNKEGNSIPSGDAKEMATPIQDREKIGRNDPCPCGSGKKYKKCCGRKT